VLFQAPHGVARSNQANENDPNIHVLLSVQCPDTVLLITAVPSESWQYQVPALVEAAGPGGVTEVRLVFSDSPERLDCPALFAALTNVLCVAKDPIHVVFKIEQASGGKTTQFSRKIRRCLRKLGLRGGDGRPYYRKGFNPGNYPKLAELIANMTDAAAARRRTTIGKEGFIHKPYTAGQQLLRDIAALAKEFPDELTRKIPKGGTVLSALKKSTEPTQLEYLLNGPRCFMRNPGIPLTYGTTRNEAFHRQLRSFFRNIIYQSGRNAHMVASIATVAKLLAGYMDRPETTVDIDEAALLKTVASNLADSPATFSPLLDMIRPTRVHVDADAQESLPLNAKRIRKNQ
jgi:hypothetical protein